MIQNEPRGNDARDAERKMHLTDAPSLWDISHFAPHILLSFFFFVLFS